MKYSDILNLCAKAVLGIEFASLSVSDRIRLVFDFTVMVAKSIPLERLPIIESGELATSLLNEIGTAELPEDLFRVRKDMGISSVVFPKKEYLITDASPLSTIRTLAGSAINKEPMFCVMPGLNVFHFINDYSLKIRYATYPEIPADLSEAEAMDYYLKEGDIQTVVEMTAAYFESVHREDSIASGVHIAFAQKYMEE